MRRGGVEEIKSDHFFERKSVIMSFSSLLFTEAVGTVAETRNGGEKRQSADSTPENGCFMSVLMRHAGV